MAIEAVERPRERLLTYGASAIAADELVGLVLGTGTRGRPAVVVAAALLAHTGGLAALSRASPRELAGVSGVGHARATRLAAAFELGRRAVGVRRAGAVSVQSAADVFERLHPRVAHLSQEVFLVLALDVRNTITEEIEVARGCLTGVDVHPREVFRPLIRAAAAGVVVVHNHPSGDPRPSPEDIALTQRLRAVGELVGIPLLDHVIIGGGDYISLAERCFT